MTGETQPLCYSHSSAQMQQSGQEFHSNGEVAVRKVMISEQDNQTNIRGRSEMLGKTTTSMLSQYYNQNINADLI